MRSTLELLRRERRARAFFAAYGQSALGNGAGYVALVVIAHELWDSPWAIALVLMADFIPAMLFGPLFGAAVDRFSRRRVAVLCDVARGIAFIALAFTGSFWAVIAFALVAGAGAGLFTPAILAGLPSLVEEERIAPATALYGALTDLGRTLGPAIAALVFAVAGAEALALANGVSFLICGAVLATLPFGGRPDAPAAGEERPGLLRDAREGVTATARMPGIRTLILASSTLIMFAATLNVAELLVAEELGSGSTGYSIMVAAAGLGFVVGSLAGAGGAELPELKRRYLGGMLVTALGLILVGIAPALAFAVLALAMTGAGNGLMLVHERLLFQRVVPDRLMGRAFALADSAGSWAFALAFIAGGALLAQYGTQPVLVAGGAASIAIWAASVWSLRATWTEPEVELDTLAAPGALAEPRPVGRRFAPESEPRHVGPATPAARLPAEA